MSATTATEVIRTGNELLAAHEALILSLRDSQREHRRQLHALRTPPLEILKLPLISPPQRAPSPSSPSSPLTSQSRPDRPDLPPAKRTRLARYHNYVPEEETIRNDYSQRYVDGGEWTQNWVLGAEPKHRFEEYPKQQRLLNLKKASVANHSLPSSYLPLANLTALHPCKFDAILLDPPFSSSFTWDTLQDLPIPVLAADPSFVFLWVGSGAGEGLERGREVLAKWGYRRCEDVVWVKTNKTSNRGPGTDPPTTSLLTRTKQHCLIGIRGTVRRSTDSWFVHCNVDTDVIIWEGDPFDPTRKPPEMYTLIENFCLGTRRLEIFGKSPFSLRRGWVTVLADGQTVRGTQDNDGEPTGIWEKESWENGIRDLANGGKFVVPMSSDIDALRPKSPFRPGAGNNNSSASPAMRSGPGFVPGNRGGFGSGGPQNLGPTPNQMMMQPMGMGMNTMGGMGNMGMDGMGNVPFMMGMSGLGNMGMGNMARLGMMGQQGPIGMMGLGGGFQGTPQSYVGLDATQMQPGMGQMGMGMGMGMGWPGMGGDMQMQPGQFMGGQGWEGDPMLGMNGMSGNMGMMGGGMGMGQWAPGMYDGYQ